MKYIMLLIMICSVNAFSLVLFEDNFDIIKEELWVKWGSEYATGASYSIENGQFHLLNSGAGWIPAALDINADITESDYSILAQLTPEDCYRAGILGRGSIAEFAGYLLAIIPVENKLVLAKLVPEGPITLSETDVNLDFGETYWLRLNFDGTLIEGKVWTGSVEDEPAEWLVSVIDSLYSGEHTGISTFTCNVGSEEAPALTSVFYEKILVLQD